MFIRQIVDATTNLEKDTSITIFPNPSNGVFQLQFQEGVKPQSADVYSLEGQLFFQKAPLQYLENDTIELDLSKLSKGTYLVKFIIDN